MVDFDTLHNSVTAADGVDVVVADCLDDGWCVTINSREAQLPAAETSSSSSSIAATMLDMRREDARLQTFQHWPCDWAKALARLGFSGISGDCEGSVRCVFCGRTITGFSSPEDAHLKHWQLARHYCRYLKGEDVGNVSLPQDRRPPTQSSPPSSLTSQTIPLTRVVEQTQLLRAEARIPDERHQHQHHGSCYTPGFSGRLVFTEPNPAAAMSGSHPATATPSPQRPHKSPPAPATCPGLGQPGEEEPGNGRSSALPQSWTVHWSEIMRAARYPEMATCKARLDTLSRWPLLKPSPKELAKAGFFHAKCASLTPNPTLTSGAVDPESGLLLSDRHRRRRDHRDPGRKCGDGVMCFCCGEYIHCWQRSDDAVVEHARLSPSCLYVTQLLGQQVRDDIVYNVTAASGQLHSSSERQHPASTTTTTTAPAATHHQHQHQQHPGDRLSSSQLDDLMRSPHVQTVLQMGFPPHLIRNLLSHNWERLSADTLCNLALQAAEESSKALSRPSLTRQVEGSNHHQHYDPHHGGGGPGGEDASEYLECLKVPGESGGDYRTLDSGSRTVGSAGGVQDKFPESSVRAGGREGGGGSRGRLMCKVCSEAEVKVMFRPCNHLVCCSRCMALFTSCPQCHQIIEDVITVHVT